MGLLSSILLAPFTGPWSGTLWTLDKVQRTVEEQLTGDTPVKEDRMNLQLAEGTRRKPLTIGGAEKARIAVASIEQAENVDLRRRLAQRNA